MKKVNNKKGFTLAELLVVIAIIAILVAIAVPLFNGALDSANEAVKDANYRSAQSAAMVDYLTSETPAIKTAREKGDPQKYSYEVDANKNIALTAVSEGTVGPAEDSNTSGIVEVSF